MKRALSLFAATTLASTFACAQTSVPSGASVQSWPVGAHALQIRYRQQGQTIPSLGEGLPSVAPVQKPYRLEPMPVPVTAPDATPGYGVPAMNDRGGVQIIPESEVEQYQTGIPTRQTSVAMTGVSLPPVAPTARHRKTAAHAVHSASGYGRTGGLRVMAPGTARQESGATGTQSFGPQSIPMMGDVVIPPSNQVATMEQVAPTGIDLPAPVFDPHAVPAESANGMRIEPMGAGVLPAPAVVTQTAPVALPQATTNTAVAANVAAPFTTPAEALQRSSQPVVLPGAPAAVGANMLPGMEPQYGQGLSAAGNAGGEAITPESYVASLRQVTVSEDGSCQTVHPGDVVHFTLRIQNVEEANHVFAHLQLSLNGHGHSSNLEFPVPQHDAMGGGGIGQRDSMSSRVYHFSLVVPEVQSGFYRTTGMDVRASFVRSSADPGVGVPLDRHSRDQVRSYCLAVSGGGNGQRPEVTDFRGGPVERAANGGSVFR